MLLIIDLGLYFLFKIILSQEGKVQLFWEGPKNWEKNLPILFDIN